MAFRIADLRREANDLWPEHTAAAWDRVGLVSGADDAPLRRVLFAVDVVEATVTEALEWGADAIIAHHPLLLRGVHSVAEDTGKGAMLARLIRGGCALLSAHTNADAPAGGVSDRIAERLGLRDARPIEPGADPTAGIGRVGELPETSLGELAERIAALLPATVSGVRVAGRPDRPVSRVALCGGAGDSLLDHPEVRAADAYITADLRHHPAQEAIESGGPALIDVSHWASEWLWLDGAAAEIERRLPGVTTRVSSRRTDVWDFSVGHHATLLTND